MIPRSPLMPACAAATHALACADTALTSKAADRDQEVRAARGGS